MSIARSRQSYLFWVLIQNAYTFSHELQEALAPRYYSELGESIMAECVRILDENPE